MRLRVTQEVKLYNFSFFFDFRATEKALQLPL